MPAFRKPRIGLLGIMQELYDSFLPGITQRQEEYARAVAAQLADVAEVSFPGAVRNRADIEARVRQFNQEGLDGILIVMLTYGPALRTFQALSENNLPIMLANIQPVRNVTADWDMGDLTYNQGIHGAQDMANAAMRSGIACPVVTEDWRSDPFRRFVQDWAHAAQTRQRLRRMRIAGVGQMPGMGDILADAASIARKIGPQIDHVSPGTVHGFCEAAPDGDVQAIMDEDARSFDIDPKLSRDSHRYAARFQAGIQTLLEEGGYEGFSIYFGAVAEDGRFRQLPMLAASNLMARGYGYAAEGDTTCCCLVSAGHSIAPNAHFTEMYAMDFDRDSALMSHMGEGNWKIARTDRPIRLIDRPLGIGGLENPPTVLFQARPGEATLTDLLALNNGSFRLLIAKGTILDTEEMPRVEMPYFHFRPDTGIRACMDAWLRLGGTHHQCLHLGDQVRRWRLLAELLGIECISV